MKSYEIELSLILSLILYCLRVYNSELSGWTAHRDENGRRYLRHEDSLKIY